MPELPGLWSLTPVGGMIGVIALFYWLMATGRIITRASHERELAMANKRGDEWKDTALVEREGRVETTQIAATAVESNKIVDSFFRAHTPQPESPFDTFSPPRGS